MRLVPNSWGTTTGAEVRRTSKPLREFNPCHDPKDGRFAPKGSGDCGPGNPSDPGRNRAIYGQLVPDEQGLAFSRDEAEHAEQQIGPHRDAPDDAKDRVARTLAHALIDHEGLEALAYDPEFGGFIQRYTASSKEGPPNPESPATRQNYEQAIEKLVPDEAPDPNSAQVRADYDAYVEEGGTPSDAPDPDDHAVRDDYDTYVQDERDKADEAARDAAYSDAISEFEREGEKLVDRERSEWDDAIEALHARQADVGPSPYGDVSTHPTLSDDFERGRSPIAGRYSQDEIIEQWKNDGEDAEFLHDEEYLRHTDLQKEDFDPADALAGTEYDPADQDARDNFLSDYTSDVGGDYSDIDSFETWYEHQYGLSPSDYAEQATVKDFDEWYRENYGIYPDVWVDPTADPPTFADWYRSTYGISPKDWVADANKVRREREALAQNVASALISSWATSSSNGEMKSVALQIAAERHFGLGATYAKSLTTAGIYDRAAKFAGRHKAVLGAFLDRMHSSTQAWLTAQGIAKNGYVTLYRGWGARPTQEPGMQSIDLQHGSAVDVLLQPLSSFSSSFPTAHNFASPAGGMTPLMTMVRIPVHRILATARTGYGCLNESEFVVLGGRYPAFVMGTRYVGVSDQKHFHSIAERLLRPRGRQDPTPVRGERL